MDSVYGAYALYNKTYSVILHELGHAIGLGHVPVNGNVMSNDFGGGGIDQWAATLAFDLLNDSSPQRHKFVYPKMDMLPYMFAGSQDIEVLQKVDFFTYNAKLGEQEKMLLSCIYVY